MSMMIRAAALSKQGDTCGSVGHAVEAAAKCIKEAGINKQDIDLLINTGVYKDENIAEPAMASIIQYELGINLDPAICKDAKNTFSFDLFNGACGFLYAAKVADSFIQNQERKLIMIVSSEVHPSQKLSSGFPYTHIGSAILLEGSGQEAKGFKHFFFETSKRSRKSYKGYSNILDDVLCGSRGRELIHVDIAPDYAEKLEKHTVRAIKEHIRSGKINPSEIKVIITSQPSLDFGDKISKSIGLSGISCISTYEKFGNAGSSDLIIGYCMANKKGLLKKGEKILFAGAGSGLTATLAIYEV